MQATENTDKHRAYRQRLAAKGWRQIIAELPDEVVDLLDDLKARRGLRNRNQALLQLIEQGREVAQQN
jgi:hypothetical protein